jgi:transposase-like protein
LARRWNRIEDARLVFDEGESICALARALGRTPKAVERRRSRLGVATRHGDVSLNALAKRAGVHRRVLLRVASKLGQTWPNQNVVARYRIQEEDADALLDELVRSWNQTEPANGNRRPNTDEQQGASPP